MNLFYYVFHEHYVTIAHFCYHYVTIKGNSYQLVDYNSNVNIYAICTNIKLDCFGKQHQ